ETALMNVLNGGPAPQAIGNRHPAVSPCDTYSTADHPIIIIAGNDETFGRLCGALGSPRLADDSRFHAAAARKANDPALKAAMEEILRRRTATEWENILAQANVP